MLIHAILWEFSGDYFPIWRHPSSWPPKGPPLGQKHVAGAIWHKNWYNGENGACNRERTNRTPKKITKVFLTFHLSKGRPKLTDLTQKLRGGWCPRCMPCAKFQIEIFMGYDFTADRIFDFPIAFCMGLLFRRFDAGCNHIQTNVIINLRTRLLNFVVSASSAFSSK